MPLVELFHNSKISETLSFNHLTKRSWYDLLSIGALESLAMESVEFEHDFEKLFSKLHPFSIKIEAIRQYWEHITIEYSQIKFTISKIFQKSNRQLEETKNIFFQIIHIKLSGLNRKMLNRSHSNPTLWYIRFKFKVMRDEHFDCESHFGYPIKFF